VMRLPAALTILFSAIFAGALLALAWVFLQPAGPALLEAELSPARITPNADLDSDVTNIRYKLDRPATVSIYFTAEDGTRYTFRDSKPRNSGEHELLFSGVVDGFKLPGDAALEGQVLRRVLPDGTYRWTIEATPDEPAGSPPETRSGELVVAEADSALPDIRGFSVFPQVFTPNQDGIGDRTTINAYLTKQSNLHVTLIGPDGAVYPVEEKPGAIQPGEPGLHTFDYEGGVDLGATPPPDGTYTVLAEAEDEVGQQVQTSSQLTIQNGGVPRANIANAEVDFSATTIVLGQTLVFTLTVDNYGDAPIRTTGPAPGTVYEMDQNANTLGWFDESGAWRVGVDCDTCIRDYPWRWALGTPDNLTAITEDGQTHYYLMPGQSAVVSGSIHLTEVPDRNPLYFWAGLIHEDVEVADVNNRVDPHLITIEQP
jgi:hypothetical protein